MKRRNLASIFATILIAISATATVAAANTNREDTDTRMVDAKVVEVTDARISVIARTGVEHVIAIDNADTLVSINGRIVPLGDLREGDIVTVELDAQNPVKFARNISIETQADSQVARAPR